MIIKADNAESISLHHSEIDKPNPNSAGFGLTSSSCFTQTDMVGYGKTKNYDSLMWSEILQAGVISHQDNGKGNELMIIKADNVESISLHHSEIDKPYPNSTGFGLTLQVSG
ncbi:hypothetical protein ACFE04_028052 [Oxalis oulophora]